jgi:hypothetical protein
MSLIYHVFYHFDRFTVAAMTWLTVTEYLCQILPCSVCHNHNDPLPYLSLITGFVTSVARPVPHVEQELLTHFSGVRIARSLLFCVMFCVL